MSTSVRLGLHTDTSIGTDASQMSGHGSILATEAAGRARRRLKGTLTLYHNFTTFHKTLSNFVKTLLRLRILLTCWGQTYGRRAEIIHGLFQYWKVRTRHEEGKRLQKTDTWNCSANQSARLRAKTVLGTEQRGGGHGSSMLILDHFLTGSTPAIGLNVNVVSTAPIQIYVSPW